MARPQRLLLPNVPMHVVQRGNNRTATFADDEDRQRYLRSLLQALRRYGASLHAYVLMTNHVHLLLSPPADVTTFPRMMQWFSSDYVKRFNHRHSRTGTLWEGRYKSCLVDTEAYLLACYRYIELNPVRAGMTHDPALHAWSSHRANALGHWDPLVTPHPVFEALGSTKARRCGRYRDLFALALPDSMVDDIRAFLNQQRALGPDGFQRAVETRLRRPARLRPAHRPRRDAQG